MGIFSDRESAEITVLTFIFSFAENYSTLANQIRFSTNCGDTAESYRAKPCLDM